MRLLTRREWGVLAAGPFVSGLLSRQTSSSTSIVAGVRIGAQSWVFRQRPLAQLPAAFKAAGVSFAELWAPHVETAEAIGAAGVSRAERRELVRKWRLSVPMDKFVAIRKSFDDAGVTLTSYDIEYRDDWTDDEIARTFEMAKALNVNVITSSAVVSVAPRVAKALEGTGIRVSFHNHSDIRPNAFATPDDFITAMKAGPQIGVTLDIGHFTAANFDAVEFLDAHHSRIHALHIKDRKRNQGPSMPFGQGDAPITAVLQRLRDRKWDIPAYIEFDHDPADPVAEVAACYVYCRKALETR
jgi:sugar phosphate isomerase/epimerase